MEPLLAKEGPAFTITAKAQFERVDKDNFLCKTVKFGEIERPGVAREWRVGVAGEWSGWMNLYSEALLSPGDTFSLDHAGFTLNS